MSVNDISLSILGGISLDLAKKVERSGYEPEHVLYVERVGLFPAYEIAKYFGCTISGIQSSRSGTSLKSRLKTVLRFLPRGLTHFLRQFELNSNIHAVKTERNVSIEGPFPPRKKALLIVDDAVDTGFSLKAVYDFIMDRGYEASEIRSAVLTTTQKNPAWKPDISLFEQTVLAFPWSYDSREYEACWREYHRLKQGIS